MAQDLAARLSVEVKQMSQADLLYRLGQAGLDRTIRGLFDTLRVEGNKATHEFKTEHKEAMDAVYLYRRYGELDCRADAIFAERVHNKCRHSMPLSFGS